MNDDCLLKMADFGLARSLFTVPLKIHYLLCTTNYASRTMLYLLYTTYYARLTIHYLLYTSYHTLLGRPGPESQPM